MKVSVLFCLLLILPVFSQEKNVLEPAEKAAGFTLIFNGKDLQGWRTYGTDKARKQWQVIDGALTLTKGDGGDLITEKKYKDFDFRFEWKIAEGGNSGVMWHVAEDAKEPYLTGPEYQIIDSFEKPNHKYPHEFPPGNLAGALYGLIPAKPEVSKPIGEWNQGRIVIKGSKITLYLNGKVTADIDTTSQQWKDALAKSKFADWPRFNGETTGHICLQDHGDQVAFRNMRILELSQE